MGGLLFQRHKLQQQQNFFSLSFLIFFLHKNKMGCLIRVHEMIFEDNNKHVLFLIS